MLFRSAKPGDNTARWFYEVPLWSTSDYINATFAPLLFLFASISLALSSMQVVLTTPPNADFAGGLSADSVRAVQKAFFGFSIAVIFASGLVWLLFLLITMIVLLWQFQFGFWSRKKPIEGNQPDKKRKDVAQQGKGKGKEPGDGNVHGGEPSDGDHVIDMKD